MWQDRQWRELLNLIDHLPQNSFTRQAFANDPEHVEMILEASEGKPQETGPAMADYSPEASRLDLVVDAIQANTIATLRAAGAKKTPSIKPMPRPKTAFDQVNHERRSRQHRKLVDRVNRAREEAKRSSSGGATQ